MTTFISQILTLLGISSESPYAWIVSIICFVLVLEFIGNLVTNVFAMGHKLTRF